MNAHRVVRRAAGGGRDVGGKARSYDEHEDSVYGLAWSAADPWLFASLSYDGRVVANKWVVCQGGSDASLNILFTQHEPCMYGGLDAHHAALCGC
jgi:WD40 repeat protein